VRDSQNPGESIQADTTGNTSNNICNTDYSATRLPVEGTSALQKRLNSGNRPAEIFVYGGDLGVFGELPRSSNYRISVLALPAHVSASAVFWPVDGFEVLAYLSGFGEQSTRLLVSELFDHGATRVSVLTQHKNIIKHYGVFAAQGVSA